MISAPGTLGILGQRDNGKASKCKAAEMTDAIAPRVFVECQAQKCSSLLQVRLCRVNVPCYGQLVSHTAGYMYPSLNCIHNAIWHVLIRCCRLSYLIRTAEALVRSLCVVATVQGEGCLHEASLGLIG